MALFQTLTDTFISGYDATKWTGQYGTLSYTSGIFNITNPASYTGYGGMQSLTTYDLTSSYSYVNITNVGNTALASLEIYMSLQLNSTNMIQVIVSGGNYLFRKKVAGVNTDNFTGISANTNSWIRLREVAGTTYFDYSTNGTTWTNAASFLNPFAVTALTVFLSAGTYNAEATATTVSFDNYNITPTLSTVTKTQPAISRISNKFVKTQSSISRVSAIITKTQTGTATIVRSGQVLTHHDYKVYSGNTFLGLLPNVSSAFAYSQDINTVGSQITVEVAVSADTSFLSSTTTIDTELSAPIQDETGDNLLTEGAANIVGVGLGQSLIKNGNTVVVYEYNRFYPNGKVMFTGQMSRWDSSFGGDSGNETISILVYSSGQDTDNYIISTGSISLAVQSSDTANVTGANYGSAFAQTLKPSANINVGQLSIVASVPTGSPVSVFFKLYAGDPSLDYITTISGVTTYTVGGSNTLIDTSSTTVVTSLTPNSYTFTLAANHLLVSPNTYYFVAFFSSYSGNNIVFETATSGFTLTAPVDKLFYARGTTNNVGTGLTYDSAHPVMTVQILTIGGNTTSTYNTSDPTTVILESILDNYKAQGGLLSYNASSIDATGLSLTYTFNTATVYEGVQAVLSLAPNGFYYYADLGTGIVYFKQSNSVADIIVTKNRDIDSLVIVATIETIANTILVSGGIPSGGTTNIYSQYKDSASIAKYGQKLKRISDNRITLQATANAVGNSALAQNKDERYQTTVTILNNMTNITLIKPGQIMGFRGYGNFVDGLLAQIVRVDYTAESVNLTLGILPKRIVPEFEKITRGLIAQQTIANPTAPS